MAEGDGNGGDEASAMTSSTGGKVKFFCSHGGRILPRPSDGTLKYVGGETRVVAVPRSITFSELMKKISDLFDGEYILKYQIASEDLDSLVSVKSDEDIHHLLNEYDRLEREGGSKLRTFLFPNKPVITENHHHTPLSVLGPHAVEQRFVDAINGIVRPTNTTTTLKPPSTTIRLKSYSPSPTDGSSPQSLSPRSVAHTTVVNQENNSLISNLQSRLARVQRVQSSPSLCTLDSSSSQNSATSFANPGYIHQQSHCHYCPNHGYQSPTNKSQDHHLHPFPQPLLGRGEYGLVSLGHGPRGRGHHHNAGYYYPLLRPYPGSGGHNRWGHLEQYATAAYGNSSSQFMRGGSPGDAWE